MPRLTAFAPILLALPLAGCMDVELTHNLTDENTLESTLVKIVSAEDYQRLTSGDKPFCERGVEDKRDDGSYACIRTKTESIGSVRGKLKIDDSTTIEHRDDGLVHMSIDLVELTKEWAPRKEIVDEQMLAMMARDYAGHSATISIGGKAIVETNGTLSEDGKTAAFTIPFYELVTGKLDLPPSFDALVEPGR